jgi:hypothetical protein
MKIFAGDGAAPAVRWLEKIPGDAILSARLLIWINELAQEARFRSAAQWTLGCFVDTSGP